MPPESAPPAVRPPRFVLNRPVRSRPTYCWRSTWNTGFDSAFTLFSKFALLNGLGARDLAQLFLSTQRGQRTRLIEQLHIDLRAAQFFSSERIARLVRVRFDTLARAFVVAAQDKQTLGESSQYLRYCRACLRRGLHVAIFQFLFVQRCPLHGEPLLEACERCGGLLLYQLETAVFRNPFRCQHCGHDFAPRLRQPKVVCDLRLSATERARFTDAIAIAHGKSLLFGSAQQLERHFSFFGLDAVALSRPSLERSRHEYYQFVDLLVRELSRSHAPAADALAHQPCAELIELRGGTSREGLACRFMRTDRARPRDHIESQEYAWDVKLLHVLPVYKAIRRHLWRRILRDHRACVLSVARHLWWDVEGDVLQPFCPIAEAFVRWRMFWERFNVPADLYRRPRHAPFGVQAWLSEAAPICPVGWSSAAERWVSHRVFAMDCWRHFHAWHSKSLSPQARRRHRWTRADPAEGAMTYWLAARGDPVTSCTRLFLDARVPTDCPARTGSLRTHRRWHQEHLRQIRR